MVVVGHWAHPLHAGWLLGGDPAQGLLPLLGWLLEVGDWALDLPQAAGRAGEDEEQRRGLGWSPIPLLLAVLVPQKHLCECVYSIHLWTR